jgi:hypothetical protein
VSSVFRAHVQQGFKAARRAIKEQRPDRIKLPAHVGTPE